MTYLGDYDAGAVIDFKFNTRAASSGTAVPFALSSGAVQVWKSNSTAATTAGVTLTSTFASVTGLNHCRIESTADSTFYANGGQFEAYLSAGTVNSVSVTGELVARFTLRAQASLYPTVASRTVDVSTGGEVGLDWANIGSPTTVVNLSGTTVKDATDVNTDTDTLLSRMGTPSDLGGGATLSANLSDIEAQTDDIGVAGAGLTALASQASVNTIDDFLDTEIAAILAAVDTEVAAILADTNELQTDWADGGRLDLILDARASQASVDTVDDFLDTEVAAIKAKTDQLTFTTANRVDATAITVSDKTGYSIAAGGIGSGAHSAAELNNIADATLDRNMATGTDSGTDSTAVRTPRQALRALRNKVSIAAGTATVTKEDDATSSWTAAVGTAAGNPISSVDPT